MRRSGARGDQLVEVSVQAPVVQDERTKELLRELLLVCIRTIRGRRFGKV